MIRSRSATKVSVDRESLRRTLDHAEMIARVAREALGMPSLWQMAHEEAAAAEQERIAALAAERRATYPGPCLDRGYCGAAAVPGHSCVRPFADLIREKADG